MYRKVMFTLIILCLILLMAIAWKLEVFHVIAVMPFFSLVKAVVSNSWFSGICCSIIAVFLIYKWQVWYSKKKLKTDPRCNEVIEDIYNGIEEYSKFADTIPLTDKLDKDEDYHSLRKKKAEAYVDFYKKHNTAINITNISMAYEGNDLLLESIQSCFFINLNFELLGIINNIKNRLSNLRKKFPEIIEIYERYEKNPNDEDLMRLGDLLPIYLIDLKYMAVYWKALFDYLEYDPTFIKLFVATYNRKYPIEEDMKLPIELRNTQAIEVEKVVRKDIRSDKWKHFWIS